jgi:hypothetical protein
MNRRRLRRASGAAVLKLRRAGGAAVLKLRRAGGVAMLLGLPLLLAGCLWQAPPRAIAAFPQATPATIATYPQVPRDVLLVQHARLEIEVSDAIAAAGRAGQIAAEQGGWLAGGQTWYQGERPYSTVTLAVPVARFDAARRALDELGTVVSEVRTGDFAPDGPGAEWRTYSSFTLVLRPAPRVSLPALPELPPGWNPLRTLGQAFGVTAAILQFVLDVLIWLLVVGGPFVLAGLGLRALVRRWRARGGV